MKDPFPTARVLQHKGHMKACVTSVSQHMEATIVLGAGCQHSLRDGYFPVHASRESWRPMFSEERPEQEEDTWGIHEHVLWTRESRQAVTPGSPVGCPALASQPQPSPSDGLILAVSTTVGSKPEASTNEEYFSGNSIQRKWSHFFFSLELFGASYSQNAVPILYPNQGLLGGL